jgi:hypothetical protein
MADDYTTLNPGTGGDVMDEVSNTFGSPPTTRKRPKVVVTGTGLSEIVEAKDVQLDGDEMALIVRPIVSKYPGTNICSLQSVTLVASSSETTVATYTVTTAKTFYFIGFAAEGDVHAVYKVYVDSSAKLASRSSAAFPSTSMSFTNPVFTAAAGAVITIKATHYQSGVQGNFSATIIGYEL